MRAFTLLMLYWNIFTKQIFQYVYIEQKSEKKALMQISHSKCFKTTNFDL